MIPYDPTLRIHRFMPLLTDPVVKTGLCESWFNGIRYSL